MLDLSWELSHEADKGRGKEFTLEQVDRIYQIEVICRRLHSAISPLDGIVGERLLHQLKREFV